MGLQQEEHPKKTVAFQVDQEQKLKDDEVRISQSQKDQGEKIETISAEAKLKLEEKTEEVSSEIKVELEKRITKQVHIIIILAGDLFSTNFLQSLSSTYRIKIVKNCLMLGKLK